MRSSHVRTVVSEFASGFDATRVSVRDAQVVVEDVAAMEKMLGAVKATAAARVAETSVWKESGAKTAAHELAKATGTSIGQARAVIETGRRLAALPATAEKARRGELSLDQAAVIADAAEADPGAEGRLLDEAERVSLGELRDECARTKASAVDLEARRRRIHERRGLRSWVDAEGVGNLHVRDNPEVVAEMMATLEPLRDRRFQAARKEGRREPLEAYAADALHEALCGTGEQEPKASARPKLLVRVDLPALLRGRPVEGEVCEVAGYGPVAVSAVHDMLATKNPFLAAVVTNGQAVTGVAHLKRRPAAHQRSALEWLSPTCSAEGCNERAFLEIDHAEDWSKTGVTVFDLLDPLCGHMHWLKTAKNWALVPGRGKRPFVPPDDPRHPKNVPKANAPAKAA